jgi:transketolase
MQSTENQCLNEIRGLIVDGVHKAQSGHPGGALSSLDFAFILFREFLRFDPDDPRACGRDRFVLSAGHESMLLYSLFHMIGWLEKDDLRAFRQLHSRTPGHPENYLTPGVECTTGPLGQGAGMSVGFALAESHLRMSHGDQYSNNFTYALLGDGCMQEDITLGAASLAGHLGLGKLLWYYDRNRIQISGDIKRATSDDYEKIFAGFGWNVISIDGHNKEAIRNALKDFVRGHDRPTLIIGETTMAKGVATMEGTHKTHGAPLPGDERIQSKKSWGLDGKEDFFTSEESIHFFREHFKEKKSEVQKVKALSLKITSTTPPTFTKDIATRSAFGEVLAAYAPTHAGLIGGSADLEPSNMTKAFADAVGDYQVDSPKGRNINFGVREFPMSAIANGIALYHPGMIPFTATFLSFADYSRPAIRLGAIQRIRVIHEFTHDSFYLGEDGPTHQAVEHVMSLRIIPNTYVFRPADAYETAMLFQKAIEITDAPVCFCLSRQNLPLLTQDKAHQSTKGAYVLYEPSSTCEYIIFATGSEVSLAMKVAQELKNARVVSVPSWELFFMQDPAYQQKILDPSIRKRISIEAGVGLGWQKFVGDSGLIISFDRFGDSAPAADLEKEYGFTCQAVLAKIRSHFE